MEENGYKYIHKLAHFVSSLNSRRNCSIDLIPKIVRKSAFLFCTANHYENVENPSSKLEAEFASRSMTYRSGMVYKPQFTKEDFETVAISSRKPPTYTIKDEQDEIVRGKFYQKELIKVI